MNNKATVVGVNKVFLFVAIINIVFSLVVEIINLSYNNFLDDNTLMLLLMIQFYCILFPSLFYLIGNRINIKETLSFNRPGLLPSFLIVLISAPAFYAASALNSIGYYFLQFIGKDIEDTIPVPQNLGEVFISILVIAVAPAICEEILHRGILLKAYENRGTVKAVVISAIMFGIFHFDITNLLGPIFLGLLFGYYVIKTNSIFAAIIAHFMNNFLATILQYSLRNEEKDSSFYSLSDLGTTLMFGAICVFFIFMLLLCFKAVTKGKYEVKSSGTTIGNDVVSIISHWPVIAVILLYTIVAGLYILSLAGI